MGVKKYTFFLLFLFLPLCCFSRYIDEWFDFPLRDMLQAIADIEHITIVMDETIEGKACMLIDDIDAGLDLIIRIVCNTNGIYIKEENSVYYLSRIWCEYFPDTHRITIKAEEVTIEHLINRISREMNTPIEMDPSIKDIRISIDEKYIEAELLVDMLLNPFVIIKE